MSPCHQSDSLAFQAYGIVMSCHGVCGCGGFESVSFGMK